jgi:hypothetical protein
MPDIDFAAPIVPFAASSLLLKPIRAIAKQNSGGKFRACAQLFFLLSLFLFFIFARTFRPGMSCTEHVEDDGCL